MMMDTKALAKSKRAHSLRHNKKNSHHSASKLSSISSGTATASKKPAGDQVEENPKISQNSRALPSNWDRYNEEFDLGSEDSSEKSTSEPTEFVLPKSKGANYTSLISEAKAQSQLNHSSDIFHSFNDVTEDFAQGFGPMLSVKGQSMLSWIAEDDFDFDFDFEDKSNSSYEAPFLSLNLHALAEQLGKAKLSDRLFLGPDVLLPPELLNDESHACGEDSGHVQYRASAVEIDSEVSSPLIQDMDESKNNQHHSESMSASSSVPRNNPVAVLREGLDSMNLTKDKIGQLNETKQMPISKPNVDSAAASKSSTFEAKNAEAELDMLLNSFTESKFLEPSNPSKKSSHRFELFQENKPMMSSVPYASADMKKEDTGKTKTPMMSVNIGDDIDTLLKETSNVAKADAGSLSHEFRDVTSLQLNSSSSSKLQDDFDSWLDTI